MYKGLIELIEKYPIITLFRHAHPDADALGSQFALKSWLEERYPDKQIFALGHDVYKGNLFPNSDEASIDVIENSLAIILDTANVRRIDDARWKSAQCKVHFDHHPKIESFGDYEYVYERMAATCESLSSFFYHVDPSPLSDKTAKYLYMGILTDTLCFKTNNTTANTLAMAAFLTQSKLDLAQINRELFDIDLHTFHFINYLRNNVMIDSLGLAYVILSAEKLKEFSMDSDEAKDQIYQFGEVKDFKIWCLFVEKNEEGKHFYSGSLRSQSIQINEIAMNYRGGGHRNASGVKCLDLESIESLLDDLRNAIRRENK